MNLPDVVTLFRPKPEEIRLFTRILVVQHVFWYHLGMASVDQAVKGGWYELREHVRKPRDMFNHLFPGTTGREVAPLLKEAAVELENAVEGGIHETKRRRLNALYIELEEAEFSSEVFSRLGELSRRAAVTVLIIGIERALLAGDITPETDGEEFDDEGQETGARKPSGGSAASAQDIKEIIADIQQIIAADPSAKMHGAVKNILVQLQRYRNEAETFRKLKAQSSGYRLEMYSKTFAATFQSIFSSIRRNYESYQAERQGRTHTEQPSILANLETVTWTRLVTQQVEEADRVRSTLVYLSDKHSNLRGPVVALAKRRSTMTQLLEAELNAAEDCAGSETAAWRLNRVMAREAVRRLQRLAK